MKKHSGEQLDSKPFKRKYLLRKIIDKEAEEEIKQNAESTGISEGDQPEQVSEMQWLVKKAK